MTLLGFEQLFTADPVASAKTALRFVHFIGLAIGLGGATLLDLILLRFFVRRRIEASTFGIFRFSTSIVDTGLKILWLTGLGFLFHYALFDPEKLTNPKVHAKLAIVAILTLNGVFIHQVILPHVRAQIGRTLFDGVSPLRRSIFIVSGAISAVSWYFPVALGAFSQLNYKVPALLLLGLYGTLVALAALTMHGLIALLDRVPAARTTDALDMDDTPPPPRARAVNIPDLREQLRRAAADADEAFERGQRALQRARQISDSYARPPQGTTSGTGPLPQVTTRRSA